MAFCSNCGIELSGAKKFCNHCGYEISKSEREIIKGTGDVSTMPAKKARIGRDETEDLDEEEDE